MKSWNAWYDLAKEYYQNHSNLLIPASYVTPSGDRLGQWISTQRRYYKGTAKRGHISSEQILALEKIGMIWDPMRLQWELAFDDAQVYFNSFGHLSVPKNYKGSNGTNLNTWLSNQRSKYYHRGDGTLTAEQIERLEAIGMLWQVHLSKWEEMYLIAKDYFDNYGTLTTPERFITSEGIKLGAWLERQRKKYREGILSQKQIRLLNEIQMCWDPYQEEFESAFAEAMSYFQKVGDLDVPSTFITETGFHLGVWISNLRARYKHKKLSPENIQRLETIGMRWSAYDSPAQTSYAEQVVFFYARKFFQGTINRYKDIGIELDVFIPKLQIAIEYDGYYWHKDKAEADNKKSSICRAHGIQLYRLRENGCPVLNGLSVDFVVQSLKIDDLIFACQQLFNSICASQCISPIPTVNYYEDIGEIREAYRQAVNDTWDQQFEEAKMYYEKNADLRVPYNYVTESGFNLGVWITNLRSAYAGYSGVGINQSRIDQLNSIGMIWSVPEEQWNIGYSEAVKYYNDHGHLRVPVNYTTETGYKLGVWIRSQRKQTDLTQEKKDKLNQIKMIWDIYNADWDAGYQKAKQYYEKKGHLRVPAGYLVDGFPLGNWIATQRAKNKSSSERPLTKEQYEQLNAIGMIWDVFDSQWEKGYEHAMEYFKTHGDLLVPNKYKSDDGFPLGTWITARRGGYMGYGSWAKPTEAQIGRLEAIGMVWDVEEYFWMKNYNLAKAFYRKNGHLKIPKRYITAEGEALGIWIQRQRQMYRGKANNKNLTEERVDLLNQINMIW